MTSIGKKIQHKKYVLNEVVTLAINLDKIKEGYGFCTALSTKNFFEFLAKYTITNNCHLHSNFKVSM